MYFIIAAETPVIVGDSTIRLSLSFSACLLEKKDSACTNGSSKYFSLKRQDHTAFTNFNEGSRLMTKLD